MGRHLRLAAAIVVIAADRVKVSSFKRLHLGGLRLPHASG